MGTLPKLLCLTGALLVTLSSCHKGKYQEGRDTLASFGDGRFQIGDTSSRLILEDCLERRTIAKDVTHWNISGNMVYVHCRNRTLIALDTSDNQWTLYAEVPESQ